MWNTLDKWSRENEILEQEISPYSNVSIIYVGTKDAVFRAGTSPGSKYSTHPRNF